MTGKFANRASPRYVNSAPWCRRSISTAADTVFRGRQDKIEFRPAYTRCMRVPHRKWRTMSLFVARCQAARDSIRGYMGDIEYPRERRTAGKRLRLRTFLGFSALSAASSFLPPRVPAAPPLSETSVPVFAFPFPLFIAQDI